MTAGRVSNAGRVGLLVWCLGVLALSGLFFLLGCCLPAVRLQNQRLEPGVMLLLFGWCGIFNGDLAWCANPLLWVSWLFLGLGNLQRSLWLLASLLGFAALTLGLTTTVGSIYYTNEAGAHSNVAGMVVGAHCWLASMLITAAAALPAWLASVLLSGRVTKNERGRTCRS